MIINLVGGSGAMGRTHKPELEKQGHEVIISGRNSSPSPIEAAAISDLTIISVPIRYTEQAIRDVAPYSKAIMDFTGVKTLPLKWMERYSKPDTEIGGLHPLYAQEKSLKDKTIVYCPTIRSGERCKEIVSSFEKQGAYITRMEHNKHDLLMAVVQNLRRSILSGVGLVLSKLEDELDLDCEHIYKCSPSPTKLLLTLLARQSNPKNDEMYQDMREFNPYQRRVDEIFKNAFWNANQREDTTNKIRDFFGEFLEQAQNIAKNHVEN